MRSLALTAYLSGRRSVKELVCSRIIEAIEGNERWVTVEIGSPKAYDTAFGIELQKGNASVRDDGLGVYLVGRPRVFGQLEDFDSLTRLQEAPEMTISLLIECPTGRRIRIALSPPSVEQGYVVPMRCTSIMVHDSNYTLVEELACRN